MKSVPVHAAAYAICIQIDDILDGKDASIYLDEALDHVLDRKLLGVAAHGITITVEELRTPAC